MTATDDKRRNWCRRAWRRRAREGQRLLAMVTVTIATTGTIGSLSASLPATALATTTSCQYESYNLVWRSCANRGNYWTEAQGRIRTSFYEPTVCLGLSDNGAQLCEFNFVKWGLSGHYHEGVALWQYDSAPGSSVWSGGPGLWQWWYHA
jgi:hypothetical protein